VKKNNIKKVNVLKTGKNLNFILFSQLTFIIFRESDKVKRNFFMIIEKKATIKPF
jgi:hypothetical protein